MKKASNKPVIGNPSYPYLIASDLDGTLIIHKGDETNPNDTLPPKFFEVLDKLNKKGIYFCAATGRSLPHVRGQFVDHTDQICCMVENGAMLYSGGKRLNTISIPRELVEELVEGCIYKRNDCVASIRTTETVYYRVKNEDEADLMRSWEHPYATSAYSFDTIKGDITMVTAVSFKEIEPIAKELIPIWKDRIGVCVAGIHWLDFSFASKGVGLARLCDILGVPIENSFAFGDNFNDAPMLETAGTSYIMASAAPDLLERFPLHTNNALETIRELAEILPEYKKK